MDHEPRGGVLSQYTHGPPQPLESTRPAAGSLFPALCAKPFLDHVSRPTPAVIFAPPGRCPPHESVHHERSLKESLGAACASRALIRLARDPRRATSHGGRVHLRDLPAPTRGQS